ncbi:MAG: helix-turn-helix domain-containing protein [Candidatus Electrothrix sp. AR4]|nr:helix-turn-helix domain-containing protein [Candidatus Electrothrix sp. AR4]
MSYKHLSFAERYYIKIELKKKVPHNQIAKAIGSSQNTVSLEISRKYRSEGLSK